MALTTKEKYIVGCIAGSGTSSAKLSRIMKRFEKEYWHDYNKKYHKGNVISAFASWLSGLPSGINYPFYYYEIRKVAIKKGFVKKTASERTLENFEQKWFNFLAMAFFSAYRKEVKTTTKKK